MERFFHGACRFDYTDGGMIPRRFTARQLAALGELAPMYEQYGRCTAGISLKMRTDEPEIAFSYRYQVLYTLTGGFDIWENGVLVESRKNTEKSGEGRFTYRKRSPNETVLEIYLPANAECALYDFDFGGSEPVDDSGLPLFLFLGDSITQSAYNEHHSLCFAATLPRLLHCRAINRGVGSLFYDVTELDENDGLSPERVLVLLGANDIVRRENKKTVVVDGVVQFYTPAEVPVLMDKARTYLERVKAIYPHAKIYVSTQTACTVPRRDVVKAISECFDAGLRTLCSELCIPCIDGMTLTPAVPAARFTDGIHFSDLGGVTAAQSLYTILQNA